MKRLISIGTVVITLSTVGCSKKDEECKAAAAAFKPLDKSVFQIEAKLDKETAAAVEQVEGLVTQTAGRLNDLQLTDEMLITFRKAASSHLTRAKDLMGEMTKVLSSETEIASPESEAMGAIESARAALQAECAKRERKRKARRKKRSDCKSIEISLADYKNDESDIMKLTRTAEALKHLSLSTKSVEESVPPLVEAIEKRRGLAEKKRDLEKTMERFKNRLAQLSQQNSRLENNLKSYCVDH